MSHLETFYRSFKSSKLKSVFGLSAAVLFAANVTVQGAAVPQWSRFEKSFESSASYHNPAQEASLQAVFVSPSGETKRIYGFWDGASTWRIRFAPNQTGKWTYKTVCSDEKNSGLHG